MTQGVPGLNERRLLRRAFAIKLDLVAPEPLANRELGSQVRAVLRLTPAALLAALLIPVQMAAVALRLPIGDQIPRFFHRNVLRLLGIKVRRRGRMSRHKPTLFVANHSSYLDISVLGSLIPGSFVAKSEIAEWPFFGLLARLQRTVFVDRQRRTTADQRDQLSGRIARGDNLVLFPEGTSSDGNRILPFRSALLGAAEAPRGTSAEGMPALEVQPVSVSYTKLDGCPLGYHLRPLVAWYGDMELAQHLFTLAGLGRIEVVVEFHPPTTLAAVGNRKALTEYCYRHVANGHSAAITGRSRSLADRERLAEPASVSALPAPEGAKTVAGAD
ncbi:MAG: lysophospholipid acyltransferase family protein [Dongiaceae bacterium]